MEKEFNDLIAAETQRQSEGLELIPSENYASRAILGALGTVYTNKYSEGYPGRRYYGGQVNTDVVEQRAIDLAKQLFGADHANVQPYSGAPANLAAYSAWCDPGDTILAMAYSHGGHLTHGLPVTLASQIYHFVHYGMSDPATGVIDYGEVRRLAQQHRPKIILVGFSSYPREVDYAQMAQIAAEIGAVAMADIAHLAGLIAADQLANPFDHGFHIMTSTTHKTLRGPRGGLILTQGSVTNPHKAPAKTIMNLPTLVDRAVFPGLQGGPHMNVILAKAVTFREAQTPQFKTYARQTLANAKKLATELSGRGAQLITGGTDNHLMVIDTVASWGLSGAEVQELLDSIGLTLNKNVIPDDQRPAFDPSGVRLGTPAITTRGLKEAEMVTIANLIVSAIEAKADQTKLDQLRAQVKSLAEQYPLP